MLTLSPYSISRHEAPHSPTIIVHKSPSGRSLKTSRTNVVVYIDRGVGASPPLGVTRADQSSQVESNTTKEASSSHRLPATTEPAAAPQNAAHHDQHQSAHQAPPQPPPATEQEQKQPRSENLEPARSIAQLAIKRHASDTSSSLDTASSNDEPMSDVGSTKTASDTLLNNNNNHNTNTSTNDATTITSPSKKARADTPARKIVPHSYEDCDTKDLVLLIASMLLELISYNDAIPLKDGHLTRFHSRAPPGISVQDYLQRLTTHATLSPPILLSMVYYIDRLCALYPAFTITSLTVHRFLISSATVASKGLSDSFWTNKTYARVGGVSLNELALLELEFLTRLEWRIVPRPEVLVDYWRSLVGRSETHAFAEAEGGEGGGVVGQGEVDVEVT